MKKQLFISIIIPIKNESKNIGLLYQELTAVLAKLVKPYEIIFVDDNSADDSLAILQEIFHQDQRVQVISLFGPHGQGGAINAGFPACRGNVILTLDGDGQHDPSYLPQFIAAIEDGYDLVSSWKEEIAETGRLHFYLSRAAHQLISQFLGIKMRYFGATMKAYRKPILDNIFLYGDLHRFAGALVYYPEIKIKEIPIKIRSRLQNNSHYPTIDKILKVALDLILIKFWLHYSKKPFRFFGFIGSLQIFGGLLAIGYVFANKYIFNISTAGNVSILTLAAILAITGTQFIFFGLIAEMISRSYYLNNKKEIFAIRAHYQHPHEY